MNYSCWVEINLDNIRHNINKFKNLLENRSKLLVVVKADGYGHGAIETSRVAISCGVDCLGVANCQEAITLRKAKINIPILVLGIIFPQDISKIIKYNLTPAVFNLKIVQELSRLGKKYSQNVKVHVKIDSGMGRMGILPDQAVDFLKNLQKLPYIELEGIYTHLATADEEDDTYAWEQFKKFENLLKKLEKENIHIPLKHISNSAAFVKFPMMYLNMARIGIMTYGLYPSLYCSQKIDLKPAMCFKTKILQIKTLPKGSGISYGKTYITSKDTKLAILPVGYNNGYNRLLSNKGHVIIRNKKVPLVGRVCMDLCMVDINKLENVKEEEEVILFGDNSISVDEIAKICASINYEIVCQVGKSVPRIYIKN
ncbi:MAG: alanine racemase [bacterium]|nr:alanine racemase [bacterium]